jgi:hypothetical protein
VKKQTRNLIIAGGALVLAVVAYFSLSAYNAQQEEEQAVKDAESIIFVMDQATVDVTAFSYTVAGETLSFTRDGDSWVYDADPTLDIDEDVITNMLSTMHPLMATQKLAPDEAVDYGFNQPTTVIKCTTAAGTASLTVGMMNSITGDYYLHTGSLDEIYMVSYDFPDAFSQTVDALTVTTSATPTAAE